MYCLEAITLLHNNAPTHTTIILIRYYAENQIAVSSNQSYSPDLVPSNYFLFPKLELKTKDHFFNILTIQYARTEQAVFVKLFLQGGWKSVSWSYNEYKTNWKRVLRRGLMPINSSIFKPVFLFSLIRKLFRLLCIKNIEIKKYLTLI